MKNVQTKYLCSSFFIFFLTLLIVNDFYLKNYFHNYLTGKISDFAGLFIFPMFFCTFFERKKGIYLICGITFIIWKLPISDNIIELWNSTMPYQVNRVIDYSDLLALTMLPLSYFYQKTLKVQNPMRAKAVYYAAFLISCFSFIATAGTSGNIKTYQFNYSKNKVQKAVIDFMDKNPGYKVPDSLVKYASKYGHNANPVIENKFKHLNNDSANFHLYLSRDTILWYKLSGGTDDWDKVGCQLMLIGIIDYKGIKKYAKDLQDTEIKNLDQIGQQRFISKIDSLLSNEKS